MHKPKSSQANTSLFGTSTVRGSKGKAQKSSNGFGIPKRRQGQPEPVASTRQISSHRGEQSSPLVQRANSLSVNHPIVRPIVRQVKLAPGISEDKTDACWISENTPNAAFNQDIIDIPRSPGGLCDSLERAPTSPIAESSNLSTSRKSRVPEFNGRRKPHLSPALTTTKPKVYKHQLTTTKENKCQNSICVKVVHFSLISHTKYLKKGGKKKQQRSQHSRRLMNPISTKEESTAHKVGNTDTIKSARINAATFRQRESVLTPSAQSEFCFKPTYYQAADAQDLQFDAMLTLAIAKAKANFGQLLRSNRTSIEKGEISSTASTSGVSPQIGSGRYSFKGE